MAKLSRKHLQQFMRDNMKYDEYNISQLWMIYKEILNREKMLEYEQMGDKAFKKMINGWAGVEGGWLIIKRDGDAPIYYKRCCKRSNISRPKWAEAVKKLLSGRWPCRQ